VRPSGEKAILAVIFLALTVAFANAEDRCAGIEARDAQRYHDHAIQLQQEITRFETENPDIGKAEPSQIRQTRRDLLETLEKEQCAEKKEAAATKGPKAENFLQVPLIYVTDRQYSPRSVPDYYSGDPKSQGLNFGRVNAIIPDLGADAALIPGIKRVTLRNEGADGEMGRPEILSQSDFDKAISDQRQHWPQGYPFRILLFVHGYNVSQHEAALSAARLAVSLRAPVLPLFYSWPSQGRMVDYPQDEDTARTSYLRFMPFLEHLLSCPADEIVIVSHSMGVRIVAPALGELVRRGVKMPKLSKVAFAAPDMSISEFNEQWRDLNHIPTTQWTLYESSNDLALYLSHIVHRYQRVGDSNDHRYVLSVGDTIDASATASVFQWLGHSYIVHSPVVGSDLGNWISQNLPPFSRGLVRGMPEQPAYWRFR
jgi:esterase/lipase superfamily enzyme